MRLLIYSPAFLPHIGGLEINTAQLSAQLVRLGQEVVVVTRTPGDGPDGFPFRVVRDPSPGELLRWTRWCDVFLQQNVSLRGLWPLLLVRRPWIAVHHSWYCRTDGRVAWQDRLKRRLLRRAVASVSVSRAVAEDLTTPSVVIPNPYRDEIFRRLPGIERSAELVYVGRLVSDKGVKVLLDALALLAGRGLRPHLSVVGDGPERPALVAQAERLGLAAQVEFLGTRQAPEVAEILNRHQVLVVPSLYQEPFGIVALEGIACGCLVVGSQGGGLKDAIGPCGLTFPNGDATTLASILNLVLGDPAIRDDLLRQAPVHLASHTGDAVARLYLRVIEGALEGGGSC
jgi:glycosyltransferase involved in cell wall biosynthesis